ncbi:hypothetical protein CEXT_382861 [Caerostris extrusa]|uniref:Uncharacterized protein n=1 Tax=Caerostris extrusa TaxID=172846 RepID=A0AAV4M8V2_CAEEX|nr:hypothetical protein CEXT_382861 [Caerostris extrusa]
MTGRQNTSSEDAEETTRSLSSQWRVKEVVASPGRKKRSTKILKKKKNQLKTKEPPAFSRCEEHPSEEEIVRNGHPFFFARHKSESLWQECRYALFICKWIFQRRIMLQITMRSGWGRAAGGGCFGYGS